MAGFDYQIAQTLHRIIRSEALGEGFVLMEALSDIVESDGGGLIVSQIKRTLSSGAVIKALEELWSIDALTRKEAPEILDLVRFQVQGARSELSNIAGTIKRWTPAGAFNAAELTAFKGRLTTSVSAAPRLEAIRLLIEEFSDSSAQSTVDEFSGRLLRAENPALVAAAVDDFRLHLSGLRATAAQRKRDFRIWGADDRAPVVVELEPNLREAVRIGERLGIPDLVAGRLARRRVYAQVHQAAEAWLSDIPPATEKLPCFWVGGRSGAGKSAALLHLLASLHHENPERVILWLGSRPERLSEAVARFRDTALAGRQIIVALDDPLAPSRQDAFAEAAQNASEEWSRISGQATTEPLLPPVIVACGPSEQREYGEENLFAELDIHPFDLPKESVADLKELADWYESRTGRAAPNLEGDVLLVQRFFEWNRGEIPDFAKRFRERLQGMSRPNQSVTAFEVVARVLAFGRLYTDYPVIALEAARAADDDLARDLDQLASADDHLSFQDEEGGVRLTHPHLADAIYRQWFGRRTDRHHRKRHLADGLRGALGRHDLAPEIRTAPLWAIARLVRTRFGSRGVEADLRERADLIRSELVELLPEIYAEIVRDVEPLTDLPIWAILDSDLALGLSPAPSRILIETLATTAVPGRGLRLTCHTLLKYGQPTGGIEPLDAVVDLLDRLAEWRSDGRPWVEWSFVAIDAIRNGGGPELVDPLLRMIDASPEWRGLRRCVLAMIRRGSRLDGELLASAWMVATEPLTWDWGAVLLALAEGPFTEEQRTVHGAHAYRFLVANPQSRDWAAVWKFLHELIPEDRERLVSLGLAWLGVVPGAVPAVDSGTLGFDRMLGLLLGRATSEVKSRLTELALQWLEAAVDADDGWSFIWTGLWEHGELPETQRVDLEANAIRRLEADPEHFGWSFVWNLLVARPGAAAPEQILRLGRTWLDRASARHSGWPFVWETLLKQAATEEVRQDLAEAGMAWLRAGTEQNGWGTVAGVLFNAFPSMREPLTAMMVAWLEDARPSHPGWASVAKLALPLLRDDVDAPRLGIKMWLWLRTHSEDAGWLPMLKAASRVLTPTQRDGLLTDAARRMQSRGARFRPQIVRAVVKMLPDASLKTPLLQSTSAWLPDSFAHQDWTIAWQLVNRADPPLRSAEDMLDLATRWGASHEEPPTTWGFIWPSWRYCLIQAGRRREVAELTPRTLEWLVKVHLSHPRWDANWYVVKIDRPELGLDPELLAAESAWLSQAAPELDAWSKVFITHRTKDRRWSGSEAISRNLDWWMRTAPRSHRNWGSVFGAALEKYGPLPDLLEDGLAWLDENALAEGWPVVWKFLAHHAPRKSEFSASLVERAERWLSPAKAGHDDLPVILGAIARHRPSGRLTADETGMLIDRFNTERKPERALKLWKLIRRSGAKDIRTRYAADALCRLLRSTALDGDDFSGLWADTLSVDLGTDLRKEVGALGLRWLSHDSSPEGWPWVFRDTWRGWPDLRGALKPLGHTWLKAHGRSSKAAHVVQARLFSGRDRRAKK
ncbi:hypothetical protein [Brevundimonas lenta]|uniref:Energy-coupling factor transporter ATP-binding protein EcfA2 n=1 Tax=Brevundimonas lenta TaxID=424796 RepID=A0A7W6JAA7_9CAUL|nr:hypothetical protein [Brevundimonas lenta]MBB4081414.1 energy-coupling factor transporter ATP-binding protein EcfA2 [Brevundimonas lenta]